MKILVDSACDLTQAQAATLGIDILPLTTVFGEESYLDGVTLSHRAFFEKLIETDILPTTSQLTPYQYAAAFERVRQANETAICITISSKLSGCWQSATIAAEEFSDRIVVVDSENACIGEQILVLLAARLRTLGYSALDLAAILNAEKRHIHLLALLDTLEYLKRGGRISPAVAFAGELLSLKPVVSIVNGEVVLAGKARGSKNGNNLLRKLVEEAHGINFDLPYTLAYSGLSDDLLQKYLADHESLYQGKSDKIPISTIGGSIGTHVGPGAIAVAFFDADSAISLR